MNTNETESPLTSKRCVPCEGGIPPLGVDEANALLSKVEGWRITNDGLRLRREWVLKNFMAGIDFFNKVAELAESEGHHPDLHLEGYRNLAVEVWTHAVGGLTENDFILAAKINELPVKQRASQPAR